VNVFRVMVCLIVVSLKKYVFQNEEQKHLKIGKNDSFLMKNQLFNNRKHDKLANNAKGRRKNYFLLFLHLNLKFFRLKIHTHTPNVNQQKVKKNQFQSTHAFKSSLFLCTV
jgi:hypothetical protein